MTTLMNSGQCRVLLFWVQHWQIPLSHRFRSLKLWFVMRSFGLKNLQAHVRHGIEMAKLLESQIKKDPNFEIPAKSHLGLVVFSLTVCENGIAGN